jgi:hypothetical protein
MIFINDRIFSGTESSVKGTSAANPRIINSVEGVHSLLALSRRAWRSTCRLPNDFRVSTDKTSEAQEVPGDTQLSSTSSLCRLILKGPDPLSLSGLRMTPKVATHSKFGSSFAQICLEAFLCYRQRGNNLPHTNARFLPRAMDFMAKHKEIEKWSRKWLMRSSAMPRVATSTSPEAD